MAKESWGAKRTCPKCEIRFYDLKKDPLICPNCEHSFGLDSIMEVFKKTSKDPIVKKETKEPATTEIQDIEQDDIILDEDLDEEAGSNVDLEDNLLEEDDEDSTPMNVITDVPKNEE